MPQPLNPYSILYKKKILQNGLSLRSRNIWQLEESLTQDESNTFSRTTSPVPVPVPALVPVLASAPLRTRPYLLVPPPLKTQPHEPPSKPLHPYLPLHHYLPLHPNLPLHRPYNGSLIISTQLYYQNPPENRVRASAAAENR